MLMLHETTCLSKSTYTSFGYVKNKSKLDHFLFKKKKFFLLCILNYAKIHELCILLTHGVYSNSKRTIQHMIFKLCRNGTKLRMPLFKLVFTEMDYVNKVCKYACQFKCMSNNFFFDNTNYNSKQNILKG